MALVAADLKASIGAVVGRMLIGRDASRGACEKRVQTSKNEYPLKDSRPDVNKCASSGVNVNISVLQVGAPGSSAFRMLFMGSHGQVISPWHDVPLQEPSTNNGMSVNVICTTPMGTWVKMEISPHDFTPLRISRKDSALQHFAGNSPWNHGFLPQTVDIFGNVRLREGTCGEERTWRREGVEVEKVEEDERGLCPLEVIDVGKEGSRCGEVYSLKVIGAIPVMREGRLSWKIIGVSDKDALGRRVNELEDLAREGRNIVPMLQEWLATRDDATSLSADGQGRLSHVLKGADTSSMRAIQIIQHAHSAWKTTFKHTGLPDPQSSFSFGCRAGGGEQERGGSFSSLPLSSGDACLDERDVLEVLRLKFIEEEEKEWGVCGGGLSDGGQGLGPTISLSAPGGYAFELKGGKGRGRWRGGEKDRERERVREAERESTGEWDSDREVERGGKGHLSMFKDMFKEKVFRRMMTPSVGFWPSFQGRARGTLDRGRGGSERSGGERSGTQRGDLARRGRGGDDDSNSGGGEDGRVGGGESKRGLLRTQSMPSEFNEAFLSNVNRHRCTSSSISSSSSSSSSNDPFAFPLPQSASRPTSMTHPYTHAPPTHSPHIYTRSVRPPLSAPSSYSEFPGAPLPPPRLSSPFPEAMTQNADHAANCFTQNAHSEKPRKIRQSEAEESRGLERGGEGYTGTHPEMRGGGGWKARSLVGEGNDIQGTSAEYFGGREGEKKGVERWEVAGLGGQGLRRTRSDNISQLVSSSFHPSSSSTRPGLPSLCPASTSSTLSPSPLFTSPLSSLSAYPSAMPISPPPLLRPQTSEGAWRSTSSKFHQIHGHVPHQCPGGHLPHHDTSHESLFPSHTPYQKPPSSYASCTSTPPYPCSHWNKSALVKVPPLPPFLEPSRLSPLSPCSFSFSPPTAHFMPNVEVAARPKTSASPSRSPFSTLPSSHCPTPSPPPACGILKKSCSVSEGVGIANGLWEEGEREDDGDYFALSWCEGRAGSDLEDDQLLFDAQEGWANLWAGDDDRAEEREEDLRELDVNSLVFGQGGMGEGNSKTKGGEDWERRRSCPEVEAGYDHGGSDDENLPHIDRHVQFNEEVNVVMFNEHVASPLPSPAQVVPARKKAGGAFIGLRHMIENSNVRRRTGGRWSGGRGGGGSLQFSLALSIERERNPLPSPRPFNPWER